jgi:tetratricopeptide (TPR) repeat protein
LGQLYQVQHRFAEAERVYKEAIPVFRQSPEHRRALAIALRSLGNAYSGQRLYPEALRALTEASELVAKALPNERQLNAQILIALGMLYFGQGNVKKAEGFFLRASGIEPPGLPMSLADVYLFNDLGLVYASKDQRDKAESYYKKALQILGDGSGASRLLLAAVRENLGRLYLAMKRYEEAESEFKASLNIIDADKQALEDVRIKDLHGLSQVYVAQSKELEAQVLLTQAVEIGRKAVMARPFLPGVLDTYAKLLTQDAKDLNAEARRIRLELSLTVRTSTPDK